MIKRRLRRWMVADVIGVVVLAVCQPLAMAEMRLPDGTEFQTWEQPLQFSRTYYVDGSSPDADDNGPGTSDKPFKTISKAAAVLQPGERVVIAAGTYRECVRPARGEVCAFCTARLEPGHTLVAPEGTPAGVVTSATFSFALDTWLGLGYVNRSFRDPGTLLHALSPDGAGRVAVEVRLPPQRLRP